MIILPKNKLDDLHTTQRNLLIQISKINNKINKQLSKKITDIIRTLDRVGWTESNLSYQIEKLLNSYWRNIDRVGRQLLIDAKTQGKKYLGKLSKYVIDEKNWNYISPRPAKKSIIKSPSIQKYIYQQPIVGSVKKNMTGNIKLVQAKQQIETNTKILRTLKEVKKFERNAKKIGKKIITKNTELPKIIKDIKNNIKNINNLTDRELNREFKKIRSYIDKLKPGSRVSSAYSELLQKVDSRNVTKKSIERWAEEKQQYLSERIIETETQAEFRNIQLEGTSQIPWLIGYRWHMSRSKHSRFLRSKPGRSRKFGGSHCLCEVLDGTIISVEDAIEYKYGAHPHCACYLEEVFDEKKMAAHPITKEEEKWLEKIAI